MKKLKCMKVANAVMAGGVETTFLRNDLFDLTLRDGVVVDILDKRHGHKTQTSLFNVQWWEELPAEEAKPSKKA